MACSQWFPAAFHPPGGDADHAPDLRVSRPAGAPRPMDIWPLLLALVLCLTTPAAAQGRGSLQVSTRVLPVLASRMALTEALGGPVAPVGLTRITREVLPVPTDSVRAALPPRGRVTIAFVRN